MASEDFDAASARYHVRFRHNGKPFKRSLKSLADSFPVDPDGTMLQRIKTLLMPEKREIPPPSPSSESQLV